MVIYIEHFSNICLKDYTRQWGYTFALYPPIPKPSDCLSYTIRSDTSSAFLYFLPYGGAECNTPNLSLCRFVHLFTRKLSGDWWVWLEQTGHAWIYTLFFLRANCLQGVCALLLCSEVSILCWPCPTQQCLWVGSLVCLIVGSVFRKHSLLLMQAISTYSAILVISDTCFAPPISFISQFHKVEKNIN